MLWLHWSVIHSQVTFECHSGRGWEMSIESWSSLILVHTVCHRGFLNTGSTVAQC